MEYWRAFQETSGSRQWTQGGPTEIPYLAKIAWLDENLIDDVDDRHEFLTVIAALDVEYIKHYSNNK